MYPLWMLKYLPNMPACHIGIFQDARGPNNTHTLGDTSGLTALAEAADVIRRGVADAVIAGATSSRLHPGVFLSNRSRQFSQRRDEPAAACRPFDADRDGMVFGEGAAAFVLEAGEKAKARVRSASPASLVPRWRSSRSAATAGPRTIGRSAATPSAGRSAPRFATRGSRPRTSATSTPTA